MMRVRGAWVLAVLLCMLLLFRAAGVRAQEAPATGWKAAAVGMRALAITSHAGSFWVCGVGEGIASSADGEHWEVKHRAAGGSGALLLGMGWGSASFGYAYGSGGTMLTTEDGGATWTARKLGNEPILLAAFVSPEHGIFRTRSRLLYVNGGTEPQEVTTEGDTLKRLSYVPQVAALTPDRMAALVKEGEYGDGGVLATVDGGRTWSLYAPPSTGIASLVAVNGRYWLSGTEVVEKEKAGGGHGVPLAMSSGDGAQWTKTGADLRACHWDVCTACTEAGCLASETLRVNFFGGATSYGALPPLELTARWAAAAARVCTIREQVACASEYSPANAVEQRGKPAPRQKPLPLLGSPAQTGILRCLLCGMQTVYVDPALDATFTVHVGFTVRPDGTVEQVEALVPPSPDLEERIKQQAMEWLFEPPVVEGKPARVTNATDLTITAVKPR